MQFSDLDKNQDATKCDAVYENASFSTSSAKPATDLPPTSEYYEELRLDTKQNDGRKVKDETKRDTIQWKDLPKQIKYIIYTSSAMLVILYIIVIIAIVVMSLPKGHDGTWSDWESWGSCSESCDGGVKSRIRTCTNPGLSILGKGCKGSSQQVVLCNKNSCDALPRDGAWSNWENWGSCSESCGGGIKSRLRTCTNPRPSILGEVCEGSSEQVILCNKHTCDDHKVAFLAYGRSTGTTYSEMRFPMIQLNSGSGYSSSTGRFTCKISGIYNFAVTLTKVRLDEDFISAYLRINGVNKLQLYSNPTDAGDYSSYSLSVTGNFHLHTNDYVYVYAVPEKFYNDYSTSFTGVLVIPDDLM